MFSVEDFMAGVIFGKFLYFKKCAADVCGDILTERWFVPGDVSVSSLILTSGYILWRWRFKFQLMVIPTMLYGIQPCIQPRMQEAFNRAALTYQKALEH